MGTPSDIQIPAVLEHGFVIPQQEKSSEPTSVFSILATTNLGAVKAKKIKKCFTGPSWWKKGRDSDFDNWISADQPEMPACAIMTLGFSQEWTFMKAAANVLGIGVNSDIVLLGNLLIEHGYTMTLVQTEEMVEKTKNNEKTEMSTDGYGNFFFTETGDPKNPENAIWFVRSVSPEARRSRRRTNPSTVVGFIAASDCASEASLDALSAESIRP